MSIEEVQGGEERATLEVAARNFSTRSGRFWEELWKRKGSKKLQEDARREGEVHQREVLKGTVVMFNKSLLNLGKFRVVLGFSTCIAHYSSFHYGWQARTTGND